ncbi:hypothetical protein [Thiobacillus sp.]|jgi:hypothetical protein|uniref:hypothetical protein n=1 Tax=Thiobacillus sp. TaxID=924 RepID=UPI0025E288C3|nr:hypothetical protein [Thiobacillus sp.]
MLFLIPHLFPSARLLEAAAQDLRLPALQTLLARGYRQPSPAEGVEAALCEALGIARQQDWPVAPISLEADGGVAGEAYWLRADPVHLRVMRDRIVLADNDTLELTQPEADALTTTIGQHFGADPSPIACHPTRWYLRLDHVPRLTTCARSVAVGCDIDPLLPHGDDAMQFRAWSNEVQMLLHDHPVNLAREARGELPVNALWLWGGGCLPAPLTPTAPLYARNADARALGAFCAMRVQLLPEQMDISLLKSGGVMLLDNLTHAGQYGDAYGWREALRGLERDWFVPLRGALHRSGPQGLSLNDPVNGKMLRLQASDAWKFWRHPRDLVSMLA